MLELRPELGRLGFTIVAVGFSPPDALADLARHLGWPGASGPDAPDGADAPGGFDVPAGPGGPHGPLAFCSDEARVLYDRLGLGRAGAKRLFTPRTLAVYAAAAKRGVAVQRPVEDARQLGGDALVVDGVARLTFRPASPDDRPSPEELLDGVRSLA